MSRKRIAVVLIGLTCLVLAGVAVAGTIYKVRCQNPACNHEFEVNLYGGRMSGMITGYCLGCQKFVSITYKRTDEGKAASQPAMIGNVWLPETGETRTVYKCPECGKPFIGLTGISDLKACPKCGKTDLKATPGVMYD